MSSSAAAPTTPRGQSTDTSTPPGAPSRPKKKPRPVSNVGEQLFLDGARQAGGRRRRRKSKRKSRKKSHKKKRKTKRRRKSRKKRTKRRRRR